MKLTEEYEKEIRDYWHYSPTHETREWKMVRSILSTLDETRAQLEEALRRDAIHGLHATDIMRERDRLRERVKALRAGIYVHTCLGFTACNICQTLAADDRAEKQGG